MRYNGYTAPSLPLLCTVRKDFQTQSTKKPNQDIQHIRRCRGMNTFRHVTSANDVTVILATPHSLTVQEGGGFLPEAEQKKTGRKKTKKKTSKTDFLFFLSVCFNFALRGVQTSLTAAE